MSEVDLETIRFLLETLRFELPALLNELKQWIRLWIGSWNRSRNMAALDNFRHALDETFFALDVWELTSSELTTCGFVQTESATPVNNISDSSQSG